MLESFLQIDKESQSKFFFYFSGGGGGGGWGCGWKGVNIMYKSFKWHFYTSKNKNVPNCSEIHA